MNVLEERLTAHLHDRAGRAPIASGGWAGIRGRIEIRHRRRQRARVAATALCLVAVVGGLTMVREGSGGTAGVATGPITPDGPLPRLVLDLPGWTLAYAAEALSGQELAPAHASIEHTVLAEPGKGYDGRVVFVTTVAPGENYGVGDRSPTAVAVEVGGQPAWLQSSTTLAKSLGWYLPDGRAVHLVGLRVTDEELLALGRDLRVGPDGTFTWASGSPPGGLTVEGAGTIPSGMRPTSDVRYEIGNTRASLRLQGGGQPVLLDLVADRAASASELRSYPVDGQAGVLARYEGQPRWALVWEVRPGVVAEVVLSDPPAGMDVGTVVEAIREVDESMWQDVLDEGAPRERPVSSSLVEEGQRTTEIARSMCRVRTRWLGGDVAARALAVEELRNLRRHGLEVGLDRNTDLVAVMDRLLAAMAAGDSAKVRTIPEGGACG